MKSCLALGLVLLHFCTLQSVFGVRFEEFFGYPFGTDNGDSAFPKGDDALPANSVAGVAVPDSLVFPYFCNSFVYLNINSNGYVSFLKNRRETPLQTPTSSYEVFPFDLEDEDYAALVAVFWADVDISGNGGGEVWYRAVTQHQNRALLQRISTFAKRYHTEFPKDLSFTWALIVTWDHVGYSRGHTDKLNTFQLVLATDGAHSVALLNYAENGVNWVVADPDGGQNGFGEFPAIVGYNAGHDDRYFDVHEDQVLHLDNTTGNTEQVGQWIFRIDEPWPEVTKCKAQDCPGCQTCDINPCLHGGQCNRLIGKAVCTCPPCYTGQHCEHGNITVSPTRGNQLGGTAVIIEFTPLPCINSTFKASCTFDSVKVDGVIEDRQHVVCPMPKLNRLGTVPFALQLYDGTQLIFEDTRHTFYSVPFDQAHQVDLVGDLLWDSQEQIQVQWSTSELLPTQFHEHRSYEVNITLYEFDLERGEYQERTLLANNVANTGRTTVHVPMLRTNPLSPVVPMALKVSTNIGGAATFGMWSPVAFIYLGDVAKMSTNLRWACSKWYLAELEDVHSKANHSRPCPPVESHMLLPGSGFTEVREAADAATNQHYKSFLTFFYRGARKCYRSVEVSSRNPVKQCCYDKQGDLLEGPPGGSRVIVSPVTDVYTATGSDWTQYYKNDILPYIYCCKGEFPDCDAFFEKRPSVDNSVFAPQRPPGAVYGDPHLITLDGGRYTFNGKGVFYLVKTLDNSFEIQVRLVEVSSRDNMPLHSTVIAAVAAKEYSSDTVVFEASKMGLRILVEGETVDLILGVEQHFTDVTLLSEVSTNRVAATFSTGAFIEVRQENGFVAVLMVSLPQRYKNTTRGLLGTFTGNTLDDFVAGTSNTPLPINSSREVLHNQFGSTWRVEKASQSLFPRLPSAEWDKLNDPSFVPVFQPNFTTPELNATATAVCSGEEECLFDVAVSGRLEVGLATLEFVKEYRKLLSNYMSTVVCDPACDKGICVANNTCRCRDGYHGDTCSKEPLKRSCLKNPCLNGGSCRQKGDSFLCECPSAYLGLSCEALRSCNCLNGGTCLADGGCTCPVGYSGDTCQDGSSSLAYLIGGLVGGSLSLLLVLCLVSLVLCVCIKAHKKRNKQVYRQRQRLASCEDEEYGIALREKRIPLTVASTPL